MERSITRVERTPPPRPGFIGEGHLAVEVVAPVALEKSDPFVLLMDDRLDIAAPGRRIGEAHPHAGLETVTLVLEGELRDRDEGTLAAGDALWMTAGRGIIHNEDVFVTGRARVLQLWVRLSRAERDADPRFEVIKREGLPTLRGAGVEARLYSGRAGSLESPTKNHVPVTLIDVRLEHRARFRQALPETYHGFVYALEGTAQVGGARVRAGDVGWLDRDAESGATELSFIAEDGPARIVLYAGAPQREPLVQHGPFVADSKEGIIRMHARFRAGAFVRMSELARGA